MIFLFLKFYFLFNLCSCFSLNNRLSAEPIPSSKNNYDFLNKYVGYFWSDENAFSFDFVKDEKSDKGDILFRIRKELNGLNEYNCYFSKEWYKDNMIHFPFLEGRVHRPRVHIKIGKELLFFEKIPISSELQKYLIPIAYKTIKALKEGKLQYYD